MPSPPPAIPNPVYDRLLTGFYKRALWRTPAYRPHGGSDCLLMLGLEGAGSVRLPDGSFRVLRRGELSLHMPGVTQWYGVDPATGFWSIVWAHFQPRPHWLEWLSSFPEAGPGLRWACLSGKAFAKTKAALLSAHMREREGSSISRDFAMNSLESALLEIREAAGAQAPDGSGGDPGIAKAMAAIGRSLAEPPQVPELAKIAGMSVSGFAHRFKEAAGVPPLQYSLRLRLERAASLLRCAHATPVKALAASLGFEDSFYFSRLFRKRYGLSPAAWRRGNSP